MSVAFGSGPGVIGHGSIELPLLDIESVRSSSTSRTLIKFTRSLISLTGGFLHNRHISYSQEQICESSGQSEIYTYCHCI